MFLRCSGGEMTWRGSTLLGGSYGAGWFSRSHCYKQETPPELSSFQDVVKEFKTSMRQDFSVFAGSPEADAELGGNTGLSKP